MNQNQNQSQNKSKNEDGLPDIAEAIRDKKTLMVICLLVVIAIISGIYWKQKPENQVSKAAEENYTVVSQPQPIVEKPELKEIKQSIPKEEPPKAQPVNQETIQQELVYLQEKQKELQQRLSAPLMLVNSSPSGTTNPIAQTAQTETSDTNVQFMNQVSAQRTDVSVAAPLGPLNSIIAEGNFIHAILESATNSDLPGYLRAKVSEPVYSEDGAQILIPEGSRLIGQYKSGLLQGQSRIYVVWTRLITTAGYSLQLGSLGVDSLAVAGTGADVINRHFWAQFGKASLLSLIGAGAANVGVNSKDQNNSSAIYREALASSFSQSANQSLQQDGQIAPTLKTHQGKPIMVFVARDLNFQSVIKQTQNKLNVF